MKQRDPSKTFAAKYVWRFKLDRIFQLNMTFKGIKFEYMNLQRCFVGQMVITSQNNYSNDSLTYCGRQSVLEIYPKYNDISLALSFLHFVNVKVMMTFFLIDYNQVCSWPINPNRTLNLKQSLYFPLKNLSVHMYQLVVKQYQNIIVGISTDFFFSMVFDGPGALSNILTPVNQTTKFRFFQTSAFQSLVSILRHLSTSMSLPNEKLLKYWASQISASHSPINDTKTVTYSAVNFSCTPVISVDSYQDGGFASSYVKIAINSVVNSKHEYSSCTYSGLAAFNLIKSSVQDISTICFSFRGYKHQNIYSQTPKVILVFYEYSEYTSLNATLTLSQTNCRSITLNTCLFMFSCSYSGNDCDSVKQHPDLRTQCLGGGPLCRSRAAIFPRERLCIVVQLKHHVDFLEDINGSYAERLTRNQAKRAILRPGFQFFERCELSGLQLYFKQDERVIHINTTGFIAGTVSKLSCFLKSPTTQHFTSFVSHVMK